MIHRLDIAHGPRHRRGPGPAPAHLERAGRGDRRRRAVVPARPPDAAALHLHRRGRRFRAADPAAASPASGAPSTVRGSGSGWGRSPSSPVRSPRSCWPIFFAGYLVQTRDALSLAGRKVLGFTFPARPRPRPDPRRLGAEPRRPRLREGPRLLAAAVRPVRRRCSTSPPSAPRWIAIGMTLFCGGAYLAYLVFGHVQQRVHLWLHPFAPGAVRPGRQGPDGHGRGWPARHRPGPRSPRPHLLRRVRLHHPQLRRGARPDRPVRPAAALRAPRRARPAHRARRPRRVRQAARRRAGVLGGPAVLRRRRRRHPGHPAHRPDHAVPVLRRLLPARQLDPRRPAAAHQRPSPADRSPRSSAGPTPSGEAKTEVVAVR